MCEHLVNKYPNLPARALAHATHLFTSNETLTTAGKRLGVQDFVRWTPHEVPPLQQCLLRACAFSSQCSLSLYVDRRHRPTLQEEDRGEDIIVANTMEALVSSLYFDQVHSRHHTAPTRLPAPQMC